MLPYSQGIILDNANNYGIVKTETVFGFAPSVHNSYVNDDNNSTRQMDWILSPRNFGKRSLQVDAESSRALKSSKNITTKTATRSEPKPQQRSKKKIKKIKKRIKNQKKRKGKVKKCIFKVFKKGKKNKGGKMKFHKKYMMPMILGLLAAKSLLIPLAMKALAFLSAKGLMMGFFSTVMASVLSLKGMFDHSHAYYANRKDDTKTQVEIIQVPTKSEDHVYYDEHYKRGDYIPLT